MDLIQFGFQDKLMRDKIILVHSQLLAGWLISSKQEPGPNHIALRGDSLNVSLDTLDMIDVI